MGVKFMALIFSINNKKFTGEYRNKIVSGIHKRYKKIYPDSTIEVEYKISKGNYIFFVYVTLNVINEQGVSPEKTLIREYNNYDAITYFSSLPLSEYLEEYDDAKKNYLAKFIEEVNAIIMSYKMLGMEIDPLRIQDNSDEYSINIPALKTNWVSSNSLIYSRFRFKGMIMKEEYESHLRNIKAQLKQKYEKWCRRL